MTVLVTQSGLTLCHPGTAAHQAPLSVGFSRQVGCHALLQRISLTQGLNLCHLTFPALAGGFLSTSAAWKALCLPGLTFNTWEGG